MKTIHKNYEFHSPIETVWETFVNPEEINKWDGGPAVMSDKEGEEFKLWNGDVWGKNIEVQKNKKLVQDWYGGKWKEPSKVTFTFSEEEGKTSVKLTQENVPDEEVESVDSGWDDYYLGAIHKYIEAKKRGRIE